MKSSRIQRESGDFLQTPHSNRQRIRQKQKLSQDIKSKYIQQLEQRNRKLKYQIIKINEMLEQQKEKVPTGKKQRKLIQQESSADVIKKELDNVYKQIKNYQREISNLENKQAGGLITDKMSRLENILKEKTVHLQKLKNELSVLTKNSIDNSKKLKDNFGKEQLQNSMLKYNDEMKVLREKLRNAQEKEKKKMENAKKQYDYIKKLQRELVENGVSMDQLEEMKKNNIFNQIYDKLNSDQKTPLEKGVKKQEKSNQVEDITMERFLEIKNEIKLYKKLHQDYDKRIDMLQKEKNEQQKKMGDSKKILDQKQVEIKKLQNEINELKSKMRKNNIKANYTAEKQDTKEKSKDNSKATNKLRNLNQKTISDQTHLKYDEKGLVTQKGVKFTDRAAIGKAINSKISSVKVWTEKTTFAICGIQCFYKIGDQIKEGGQHISSQAKKSCTQNLMELADGDFVKNISGHLSQNNIIEYLVLISNNSIIGRFGIAKPTQKQFNFDIDQDQMPICLYGSLITIRDSKKELTYLEQIGLQISRDKNYEKDRKMI